MCSLVSFLPWQLQKLFIRTYAETSVTYSLCLYILYSMSAVDLPNLNVDTPMTPVQETHFGRVNMFNVWYGYKQLSSCYW